MVQCKQDNSNKFVKYNFNNSSWMKGKIIDRFYKKQLSVYFVNHIMMIILPFLPEKQT